MRNYGSLKPQIVIINWVVAKYAEKHLECDLNVNVPSRVIFLVEIFVIH